MRDLKFRSDSPLSQRSAQVQLKLLNGTVCERKRTGGVVCVVADVQNIVIVLVVAFVVVGGGSGNILAGQLLGQALNEFVAALAQLLDDGIVARGARRALNVGGAARSIVVERAAAGGTHN